MFPNIFQNFPKMFQTCPKTLPEQSQNFPKMSKHFQKFTKRNQKKSICFQQMSNKCKYIVNKTKKQLKNTSGRSSSEVFFNFLHPVNIVFFTFCNLFRFCLLLRFAPLFPSILFVKTWQKRRESLELHSDKFWSRSACRKPTSLVFFCV